MGFWGHISADYDGTTRYPSGPVKPGGLTDRWLSEYPNLHGDLSARSGLGALTRDSAFARAFVRRHGRKLLWGTDCACKDGKGTGQPDGQCLGQASKRALAALLGNSAALPGRARRKRAPPPRARPISRLSGRRLVAVAPGRRLLDSGY